MEKGLFFKNWEIACFYDVLSFADEEGYFELSDNEREVMEKSREHLQIIADKWYNLSTKQREEFEKEMQMVKESE